MILQPASRREVSRIAIGSGVCACIQILVFWVLSLLGIGTFNYRVVIGTIGGSLVAILCFAQLCITLQKATAHATDEKFVKTQVRNGYNLRKLMQILWVIAAFVIPWINVLTAMIPLFFPNVVIYYLQIKGKLFPAGEEPAAPAAPTAPAEAAESSEPEIADDPDDDLGPFEV